MKKLAVVLVLCLASFIVAPNFVQGATPLSQGPCTACVLNCVQYAADEKQRCEAEAFGLVNCDAVYSCAYARCFKQRCESANCTGSPDLPEMLAQCGNI